MSVIFNVEDSNKKIEVFTTRPDTIFGVLFLLLRLSTKTYLNFYHLNHKSEIENYIDKVSKNLREKDYLM
ncbi:MAG: hypothetical protein CM15mP102_18790 [Flavobacteriales bacterium]|nr:MAG: hypothetical protein CM15mP102_18790 [Flavobacteriales bacterium]